MVNMYDQPALAEFISTYVPVNFENLYKIGTTQASMILQAADNFYGQLLKFGEFRSPSTVDTLRYYDLTLNSAPIQGIIQEAITNPNALKDPAFRARMTSVLNGVDYRSLSLLRESADNLRQGLETRAKMLSLGQYYEGWDDSNIPMYDTLGTGQVFSDITPIRWMSANELSDPYFNNLEPSSLGTVTKNGVVYDRTGISYNTLYDIASARFNDLIATPQGQRYYRDLLRSNNGNQDAARQAFIGMIADSQRDRMRNIDTVNPAFLASLKAKNRSRRTSSSGSIDPTNLIQRRDIWNATQKQVIAQGIGGDYESWLKSLNDPDLKEDQQVAKNLSESIALANQKSILLNAALSRDPNNVQLLKDALIAEAEANSFRNAYFNSAMGSMARKTFKDEYNGKLPSSIDITDRNYNPEKLLNAYNKALNRISTSNDIVSGDKGDLALLAGGNYVQVTDKGTKKDVYEYSNSSGMLSAPQMFELVTGKGNRKIRRRDELWSIWGDKHVDADFGFDTALATGQFNDVQFEPGTKQITRDGRTFFNGTVLIPVSEAERVLGTGIGYALPFGDQSTISALELHYNAKKITRKDSDGNDINYYAIDGWKTSTALGQPNDVNINATQLKNLGAGTSAISADIDLTRNRQLLNLQ